MWTTAALPTRTPLGHAHDNLLDGLVEVLRAQNLYGKQQEIDSTNWGAAHSIGAS